MPTDEEIEYARAMADEGYEVNRDVLPAAPPVAGPAVQVARSVSQATTVEQSRAIAEVQGAIVVAQQVPRSLPRAIERMEEACRQLPMAERAFFRFPRGGKNVTGPTVHLARELARCFGNVQYGITELDRNVADGYSEMKADAWDVETNVRAFSTFRNPHRRDKRDVVGGELITDNRDIYELNANMGARRVREMIFAILPRWYTDTAQDLCKDTIAKKAGGEAPLAQRIAAQVEWWRGRYGVTVAQLEAKLDRKQSEWTPFDLADLAIVGRSLSQGETKKEDEFPPERVTVEEITRRAATNG